MPEVVDLVAPPAPRLLDLAYADTVPSEALVRMERAGKRLGLPLDALEALGQDAALCDAFCRAAERDGRTLLRLVREGPLRQALEARAYGEATAALLAVAQA